MAVTLTLYTEAAPLALKGDPADPAPALGMTWFVSADYDPGDIDTPEKRDALKELLSPWKWRNLQFATTGATIDPASGLPPPPSRPAKLEDLIDLLEAMRDTLIDQPAMLSLGASHDPENEPHWPLALMQLSRADPRVSHNLNLARLFRAEIPNPAAPIGAWITSFDVLKGTVTVSTNPADSPVPVGTLSVTIRQELGGGWSVDAIKQKNRLLNGYTRCVAPDRETYRDWFSGLPAALGRAISPLLRLADLLEQGLAGNPQTLTWTALKLWTDALAYQTGPAPSALGLLFGEAPSGDFGQWEQDVRNESGKIVDTLVAVFLSGAQTPETLRHAAQSEAFGQLLAQELIRRAPATLAARAVQILGDPRNVAALLDTLAPSAIARTELTPKLASVAGDEGELDIDPLLAAFLVEYPSALARLLGINPVVEKIPLDAVTAVQLQALQTELAGLDGLDAAQDAGIAFRIDTVFKTLAPGELDIHDTLDGALVAIRRSSGGLSKAAIEPGDITDWLDFKLVSSGKIKAAFTAAGGSSTADLGLLTTPIPVALIEHKTGSAVKTQQAISQFFGQVLTPRSDLGPPSPSLREASALTLHYSGAGIDLCLDLAYGRVFEVEVGYQSLAGALPAGWCKPTAPFDFDAATLATSGTTRKQVALLRTKPPGPPELADAPAPGAPLTRLTGPRDHEVRPLWRERVAAWTDAGDRRRVDRASTVYLDYAQASQSRSFFVLPPVLSHAAATAHATDNDRVWDYWVRRDEDLGIPALVRSVAGADFDPAVIGPAGGPGAAKGSVRITLQQLTPTGLAPPRVEIVEFPASRAIAIELECLVGATGTITPGDPTKVTLPPKGMFALEFETLVDAQFFSGGDDPRFDDRLKITPVLGADGSVSHYAFGTTSLVIECLPDAEHLPAETALWDALALSDAAGTTACRWEPSANPGFEYIAQIETVRQSWKWDAGPLDDALLEALDWGAGEHTRPRAPQRLAAERAYFADRGLSGLTEHHELGSTSVSAPLFEILAKPNRGADYLRVRATAVSRYAALREQDPVLRPLTRRRARAGTGPGDIWKAIALMARRRDALSTPSVAVLAPMFGAIDAETATAGDWCAYLDHPVYDPVNGGGLAETLVAEIVVERLDAPVPPAVDGETLALSVGLDPTLSASGDPYEDGEASPERVVSLDKTPPSPNILDGIWKPAERTGTMLPAIAVLGQTLEPLSAAPIVPFAVAFFGSAIGPYRLLPGAMIKVRLRHEAIEKRVEGAFEALCSPWSATHWITLSPNAEYRDLFALPVYDEDKGAIRLRRTDEAVGDPRLARLKALIGDVPPNAGAPYLVQNLAAVVGSVVGDLQGAEVIRPRDWSGTHPSKLLEARLDGDDILFPCPAPPAGEHFLRLLEMRTVSLPAPGSPDLGTILPEAASDAEGHVTAVGPLWRFRTG